MRFTIAHIEKLKQNGNIRDFRISAQSKKGERKRYLKKVGKQLYWMELTLAEWCKENDESLVPEYQFNNKRKFRFDFALPTRKWAFEYEGIYSEKSRHTTVNGYSQDSIKYNLAAADGWLVFRYTAKTYKTLKDDLNSIKRP
jgi:hypothetical protein